jgi:hypothetical protein
LPVAGAGLAGPTPHGGVQASSARVLDDTDHIGPQDAPDAFADIVSEVGAK